MSQIRLTYGVFLSLILEARLPREATKKDHWTGKSDGLSDIDIFGEWIGIFWDKGDYMPISYQFWFIRDLMVVLMNILQCSLAFL